MLSQAVLAKYEKKKSTHPPGFSVSSVSPCPYGTYLNFTQERRSRSGAENLLLEDGQWQEKQIISQLKETGFELTCTGEEQLVVSIGNQGVTGRPDGFILVNRKRPMLEVKAMSLQRYTNLKQYGLAAFPGYRTQIQLYMASHELRNKVEGCWFYAKHKDSCRPYDFFVEQDLSYADPIIEFVDRVVSGGLEEKPKKPIEMCSKCRHKVFCWGEGVVNMSGIAVASLPELTDKWKEGRYHRDYGKELIEQARNGWVDENGLPVAGLIAALGDKDLLLCEDLKVQKIRSERFGISIQKFVEVFGPRRLKEVGTRTVVEQVRIDET